MINLRTITKENIEDILNLSVSEEQKGFVSDNSESLAQAYVYHDTAWPFAIYEDDTPIGFIMMGYYEAKQYYTLWKFMIDQRYQNKGYGRQALLQGLDFIKEKFNPDKIYTGVALGNSVAKGMYESVGFVDTGLREFGMEEMCLNFYPAPIHIGNKVWIRDHK